MFDPYAYDVTLILLCYIAMRQYDVECVPILNFAREIEAGLRRMEIPPCTTYRSSSLDQ